MESRYAGRECILPSSPTTAMAASMARFTGLILIAITSQIRPAPAVDEATVVHCQAAGLFKPSVIKPLLTTIETNLVIRQFGKLHADDQASLHQVRGAILS
jgi:mRNA interferase MazF